ncbi:single-stranded-DNA-specific exonuclease RecJ [Hominisplanchenecus murintestinalis]|uniref:Single-stranded-DNA-specific exonuclease RecJ n=1 Tax=Hominisplanchenecus murintestinalis TaxID=2941517 RepID=A0AC61QYT3_9FIRM|nr:single-stranded-DNA-specific exonuclease RecJ [Hominisplanchenecus murintestinalis]TGX98298.1 single-stranded-DNA-specific exonuclease RecJ [Hominisplanchenecus murintestinalis]
MEKWFVSAKRADFQEIGRKFGIDAVTARLIRNRDVVGDEAVREYLYGSRKDLYAPQLMKDCRKTAEILKEKIAEKKKIRVIGDYDIDGVNATCILYKGLIRCGAEADVEIPDRMKDGYGLNKNLIQYAYEEGIDTILTCDNGIAAVDEIAEAKRLGMTVLITDHHELQERIPEADAIVNPKQPECTYPYKSLCGAAVAYKLMICLYELCGIPVEETDAFIEFAAIATVGDVMDLTGENRILVKEGLKMINQTSNRGLKALIRANGLEDAQISSYHIGFVLGPCINASGRLDTAKRALELLLAEDDAVAEDLAHTLKELNDERKDMTQQGVAQAIELIEEGVLKEDKVLVVYLPDCHESLAGIIAGRIRERYHKPVFVLTDAADGLKGSGRSIETYNMFAEMSKCAELFTKFGGHPMAAGLSLPRENMEAFHKKINENSVLTEDDFIPKVTIDVPMPISYITERLVEELGLLEPFGKGNTKPLFAEKSLNILSARILGKNRNVIKLQVLGAAGTVMEAMYFGDVERFQEYLREKFGHTETEKLFQGRENAVTLSLAYYPGINEFRGNRTLQIVIQSYQ